MRIRIDGGLGGSSLLFEFTGVDSFTVGGVGLLVTMGSAVLWVGFMGSITTMPRTGKVSASGCRRYLCAARHILPLPLRELAADCNSSSNCSGVERVYVGETQPGLELCNSYALVPRTHSHICSMSTSLAMEMASGMRLS